jgi:GxxExxY protein
MQLPETEPFTEATLGGGFLEKVFERALLHELKQRGLKATSQTTVNLTYKGISVGMFCTAILVEETVILELKCVEILKPEHQAQCLNYLKASGHKLCLLLSFYHRTLECKRLMTATRETP